MSHSAFRILANDEQINRNLVIVVNKNGQVATDTEALQTLLTSKGSPNTGISILRETSPTPSISDEIEQERTEKLESKRQEYLMAHAGEDIDEDELENQMRQITGSLVDEIPHVTLSVENFYTPDQARKFANDVLHLGGIDNPQSLMPIDFNFRRQTIQNDHCYTPLTQSPERNDKSHSSKAGVKNAHNKTVNREQKQTAKAKQPVEEESSDSGDAAMDDDEEYDEEQSGDGPDISFSESDDDNDMDFSVNDRFGKKGKKKRKYRKHKQKNMTFKDFLETGEVAQLDEEPKKKYLKSPKKVQASRPSTSGKIVTSTTVKNTQLPTVVKKVVLVQPQSQPPPQPQPQPQTYIVKSNNLIRKEPTTQFVPLTVNFMKTNSTLLPGQISIQSSTPMKSKQEIEFVESIVKDLEKSFPENRKIQPNTIPNIMQMMESNTPAEMIDQSLSSLEQLDSGDGGVPGIEDIGDALIAVLGNDAIDELLNQNDLINFDATQSSPPMKLTHSLVNNTSMLHSTMNSSLMSEASTSSLVSSPQTPKVLNKQAPVKDPIKVVRNGRVITLPVITAPTTRGAKRRAQGDSPNQSLTSPSIGKVAKTEKAPSIKDPDSKNSSRRSSLAKSDSGKSSRRQSLVAGVGPAPDDELDDLNSDGSWASEDDPDRLWCICKQPHSNRFMICCDKCEDWFHGKCVNVTKAMGKEFELMSKEWRCPNCKSSDAIGGLVGISKKPDAKKKPFNQQKLTKFFAKSQKESTDEDVAKAMCIVCKHKAARDSSIFCSDECIQNSATKHLDDNSQQKGQTAAGSKAENSKRGNVLKDKSGNVIVYDKTTGKILPLSKSPHFTTLGPWLIQNPNYKPVEPGSAQAEQILSRNRNQSQPSTPTATSATQSPIKQQLTQSPSAEDLFSNPVKINTGATPAAVVKKPSAQGQHSGNSGSVRSNVSVKNTSSSAGVKSANSSSPSVSTSSNKLAVVKQDNKKLKRQVSEERPVNSSSTKYKSELERLNVRKILKETLTSRMQEFDHPEISKMTDDEITGFAKETEKEMFLFFNKDTRDKYKAKYRSLKFNLSDVKNKTLIEKICAKKLTPKQLVEASSASLASEELSKWREDETKHQLEIITKAELDALSQNKIVVKTHKGEEIIELKTAPIDILVPIVDDVESIIAKTVLSVDDPHGRYDLSRSISLNVSGGNVNSPLSSPSISSSTGRKSDSRHRSRSRSKSRGKDHHHHHHKSTSSSSKHKKGDRHRSRSPKHQSNRDRERKSRDKSHEQSKTKKSDDHKHHRDKSKSREKERLSGASGASSKTKDVKSKDSKPSIKVEEKSDVKSLDIQPDQQDVDLVGKILNSMGVHLDKPKPVVVKEEKPKEEVKPEPSPLLVKKSPIAVTEAVSEIKQEIEIYSGNMHMADVTSFDVTASCLSGNFDDIMKGFSPRLDIVGRIEPKTALDYLDKIKKFPGKKICILRFAATDTSAYNKFFKFWLTRQRYGVIKSSSPKIKDFYVIPVEASQPLPKVLLPLIGPGFIEGEKNKPDLLIGVICKILPEANVKRPASSVKKNPKTLRTSGENPIQALFAKHKSNNSKLTLGLPEFSKSGELQTSSARKSPTDANDDGDEPYTPFDDDDDTPNYNATTSTGKSANDDIGSEIDLINREIEQRQMEIQSLAKQKAMELNEEQATRIYENISVPHNLSEILSTITKNQASEMKSMEIDDDDGDDEYVPTAMGNMEYRAAASYSAISQTAPIANSMMDIDERISIFQGPSVMSSQPSDDQPSRLASMTDADLMKLVPDDAFEAPPAPKISGERKQPSIPGLDDGDYEME